MNTSEIIKYLLNTALLLLIVSSEAISQIPFCTNVLTGAEQTNLYLPFLKDKKVAVVANPTSIIGSTHLVDSLMNSGINITKVFAPEHGFRGTADAGEHVKNYHDKKTGLLIISLYGKHYKPNHHDLKNVDVLIFDMQDVGARFYTYISTLNYVMEAAAEEHKTVIVLDRPNPNGFYVDGPVLDSNCKSFVGVFPIPIVHGCSIGELAKMANEEGWLKNKMKCELKIISCANYTHNSTYVLPIKPSPNLSNWESIIYYPSLCLFEGTSISVGRGTEKPFQQYGHPTFTESNTTFTPVSIPNVSKYPPYQDQECKGFKLDESDLKFTLINRKLNLKYVLNAYKLYPDKSSFFNNFFRNLAGTETLRKQIEQGLDELAIRKSWDEKLSKYKQIRKKYLLYEDFE